MLQRRAGRDRDVWKALKRLQLPECCWQYRSLGNQHATRECSQWLPCCLPCWPSASYFFVFLRKPPGLRSVATTYRPKRSPTRPGRTQVTAWRCRPWEYGGRRDDSNHLRSPAAVTAGPPVGRAEIGEQEMHEPGLVWPVMMLVVWLVWVALLITWVYFVVAAWRGMKAHESIAESLRRIADRPDTSRQQE
jgi:hypothetical protein